MFGAQKKRKKANVAAEEPLRLAFEQLDLFGAKLDRLKQCYNNTAKELSEIKSPLPPAPPPPPVRVPLITPLRKPQTNGRYAIHTPSNGVAVPRPEPKPPPVSSAEPQRTRSGRFYLQLSKSADPTELRKMRDEVSKCGRVVDSGQGTASDPEAGWIEVAVRADDTSSFILKLEELEVKNRVDKMIQVSPGEGRLQARQLDLFRAKQDSSHKT